MAPTRSIRALLPNAALSLGGVIVPLLLLEGLLRLVPGLLPATIRFQQMSRESSMPLFEQDPLLGWRGKPNGQGAIPTEVGDVPASQNALGYRGPAYAEDKPSGVYRISVLGDSMAWGWGVADGEVFPSLLEQRLRSGSLAERVEILNFALPGYGTDQQYLLYTSQVRRFRPDLVIVVFYAGNDFGNNSSPFSLDGKVKPYYYALEEGSLRMVQTSAPAVGSREGGSGTGGSTVSRLLQSSLTVGLARNALITLRASDAGASESGKTVRLDYHRDGPAVTEALLRQLDREIRADGARMAVAYLPSNRGIDVLVGSPEADAPPQAALAWLCGLGVEVFDLAPALAEATRQEGTAWRIMIAGPHLTPFAHARVGDLLAKLLADQAEPSSHCKAV